MEPPEYTNEDLEFGLVELFYSSNSAEKRKHCLLLQKQIHSSGPIATTENWQMWSFGVSTEKFFTVRV
jgi:hypothetical protein